MPTQQNNGFDDGFDDFQGGNNFTTGRITFCYGTLAVYRWL